MAYTNVGAIPMGSSQPVFEFDAIKSIQHARVNILASSSFTTKSWLQRLFEQIVATVNQKGCPL
ncbi:hypothetical protein [Dickeya poaceiphila]|uniref:Uncharacterized protein n=1 Tax=Dickeya poaceiphila TaxID=568768 RepID=A0A5B8HJY4_9GAMM|nr:hypothetical protein [Dickeya poaceiphila]QDX29509.1 hypothetical protein Dpoa569_0001284 [Dickeya poaceiphila]